jgi:hypothetical protein
LGRRNPKVIRNRSKTFKSRYNLKQGQFLGHSWGGKGSKLHGALSTSNSCLAQLTVNSREEGAGESFDEMAVAILLRRLR